jgi:hypothetical protein
MHSGYMVIYSIPRNFSLALFAFVITIMLRSPVKPTTRRPVTACKLVMFSGVQIACVGSHTRGSGRQLTNHQQRAQGDG